MPSFVKLLLLKIAGLIAPLVTLFYRKGIWVTPDDPVSPYGQYESRVRKVYERFGSFIGDWYWLGIRNKAYGLAYKWKPDVFKTTVYDFNIYTTETKFKRVIWVEGYKEYLFKLGFFHIIYGYRLRPIRDTQENNLPVRAINMDGRPILSIRWGIKDD